MKKTGAFIIAFLVFILLVLSVVGGRAVNSKNKSEKVTSSNTKSSESNTKVSSSNNSKNNEYNLSQKDIDNINKKLSELEQENNMLKEQLENGGSIPDYTTNPKQIKMIEVDSSTLSYTNKEYSVNAKVVSKTIYNDGLNVYYVTELKPIKEMKNVDTFTYYSTLNTYNSLDLGQTYSVNYNIVNESMVSINSIKFIEK